MSKSPVTAGTVLGSKRKLESVAHFTFISKVYLDTLYVGPKFIGLLKQQICFHNILLSKIKHDHPDKDEYNIKILKHC